MASLLAGLGSSVASAGGLGGILGNTLISSITGGSGQQQMPQLGQMASQPYTSNQQQQTQSGPQPYDFTSQAPSPVDHSAFVNQLLGYS